MSGVIALAGCGNSCFVGFFNNGNGHVAVAAGSPPPACSFSTARGALRVVALKAPVCELCAATARADHVFVTLRGIQLDPDNMGEPHAADWLEIAPQLANEPRQIDLIGDTMPEILVESANVPAGGYREVRLQFLSDSAASGDKVPAENSCGEMRWNCVVMANGHAEPLHLAGGVPELLVAIQGPNGDSFTMLPDARMDLRLSLEPHQGAYFSSNEGWRLQTVLVGREAIGRRRPVEEEDSSVH
jgi:hypothetical protein